jgi:hypothetical protein
MSMATAIAIFWSNKPNPAIGHKARAMAMAMGYGKGAVAVGCRGDWAQHGKGDAPCLDRTEGRAFYHPRMGIYYTSY